LRDSHENIQPNNEDLHKNYFTCMETDKKNPLETPEPIEKVAERKKFF